MSLVTSLILIGAIAMVWYVVSSILNFVDLQRPGMWVCYTNTGKRR